MATANTLTLLQKIKWEKGGRIGSFLNDLTKKKEMREVEGSDQACQVIRTGRDCTFMTHCFQTGEKGH